MAQKVLTITANEQGPGPDITANEQGLGAICFRLLVPAPLRVPVWQVV